MRDGDGLVLDGVLEEILCGAVASGDQQDGEALLPVAHAGRGGKVDRLVWLQRVG